MPIDATTFILTVIFTFVIGSFLLYWIVRNAINNSDLMKRLEAVEGQLAELQRPLKDGNN
ncbi:hypothetical protein [Sporosarcina limicola]|uniref:Membrane protein implicated in regulation of membrane protease activity n=1 Tax=Sporosarcina limicola TaxID=34101 RepID=A0A927R3K4_9BACL|nr:hypothetical protein [Sporosarcina limicola]MBE1553863.1 membrane protein implicated in regulation of membrane protease activity [Sporosarcina limicola]